jgi:urease accessory protein
MFKRLLPIAGFVALLGTSSALAHHPFEAMALVPGPITGLISGLAHPLLGLDHIFFMAALALVGLRQSLRWMVALLGVGLAATSLGLALPGLPLAEPLVALTLVLEGLVLIKRLPQWLLLPAFALHGYVLSAAVIGWEPAPIATYLLGLLVSQAALLLLFVAGLRRLPSRLDPATQRLLAGVLMGIGAAFAWTALVA